jgi:glycosyltransferase involved in cell wall biosynthesis
MKILVTAISFSSKISGIQRHAFNLVRCLLAHADVCEVHLVIAPWQQKMAKSAGLGHDSRLHVHVAQLKPGSISRNLWHYRALPEIAERLQPDLVHLTYPVPINAAAFQCAVVLTLHDLYPYEIPANFRFPHVFFNRLALRQSLRNVDAIACVSDATLLLLKQFAHEHVWRKAVRIYNCVEPAARSMPKSPLPERCTASEEQKHPFADPRIWLSPQPGRNPCFDESLDCRHLRAGDGCYTRDSSAAVPQQARLLSRRPLGFRAAVVLRAL